MAGSRVVVAMSGGVDSSVAAALLYEQGYDVTGMMLRLWSQPGKEAENSCCTPDAVFQARRVAAQIGIPFYVLDAQEPFFDTIVEPFISAYINGETPNPCVRCNRLMRWGYLLEKARGLGAEFLASGHYARIYSPGEGDVQLLKGVDPQKDQSYMLSGLSREQLRSAMFPLGEYTKPHVREIAARFGLSVASKPDSQDLCFLADADYRTFLETYAGDKIYPGEIQNRRGEVLGRHNGLAFYTIGQRKGIRLSNPEPLYVLEKDIAKNILIVGSSEEMGAGGLYMDDVNWIGDAIPEMPLEVDIKIRYRALAVKGFVQALKDGRWSIQFPAPQRGITPGQVAVIYMGDRVLGSGKILNAIYSVKGETL